MGSGLTAKLPRLVAQRLPRLPIFASTHCLIVWRWHQLIYSIAFMISLPVFVLIVSLNNDCNLFPRCIVSIFKILLNFLFLRNFGLQFHFNVKNLSFIKLFLKFFKTWVLQLFIVKWLRKWICWNWPDALCMTAGFNRIVATTGTITNRLDIIFISAEMEVYNVFNLVSFESAVAVYHIVGLFVNICNNFAITETLAVFGRR